ncbi:MAG: succinate dehydrogenase, hydrophobic membrane anchor protein [Xanthomonadales bacterium]|nr:succinate dehydrogenase, hydrophobic membrane anchor protein [Xanthomonadales bacterium]
MSMQNPLARVRGKGSSGAGSHHWRSQRYSSLILLLLTAWVLWLGVALAGADYASARAAMSSPFNAGMAILFAGTVFYHAQLGLQVVIEDYVHIAALEFALLVLVRFACIVAFLISAIATLKLALGA